MPTTSRFIRYFQTSTGVPLVGAALWLVPQANTYPTNALALSQHETRDGMYYRNAVPDGEYKIYISVTGSPAEGSVELYEQNIWVGENKLSIIGQHFDANDSHRLTTNGIQDAAVTNTKIASYAVTEVSLADDAVTSRVIADEAVGSDQLAEEAVTTVKVADYAITTEKIDFDAVMSNQINDGAVTGGKIAPDAVNRTHIAAGEVVNEHYADGSITGNKIAAGAISSAQLDAECVSGDKIALSTITGQHLADEAVTNTKIAAYAVSEVSLADDAVSSRVIADEAVETNHLSDGSVSGSKLQNASVSTQHLVNGAVSATKLLNGNDYLKVSNGGAGVDGTPRQVSGSAAYVSQGKLQVRPGTNGDTFEVLDASGNVLLAVNTSAKTIDAKSGVKFSGDGSLLTGIVSTGTTGGTSSLTNIEIQADSDANGSGDIIFRIGSKVVARIPNAYGAGLAAGVEGSYFINSAVNTIYNGWSGIPAAYILDGTDDRITTAHDMDYSDGIISFEALFTILSDKELGLVWSGNSGNSTNINMKYALYRYAYKLYVLNLSDGTSFQTVEIAYEFDAAKLYHLIIACDGANVKIYVNGKLEQTEAQTITNLSVSGNLDFGQLANTYYWNGILYDFRLYNRPLSHAEVTQRWNNGAPHLYRLEITDKARGEIVNDSFEVPELWSVSSGNITGGALVFDGTPSSIMVANRLNTEIRYGRRYKALFTVSGSEGALAAIRIISSTGAPYEMDPDLFEVGSHIVEFTGLRDGVLHILGYGSEHSVGATAFSITDFRLVEEGCTFELLPENSGASGGIETMNALHWSTSGNPIAPQGLRDYRSTVSTTPVALTNTQKAQTILTRVILKNNNENTQTCSLGTSSGGTQLINAQSVAGGSEVVVSVNSYSATERTLYAVASAASFSITLIYEKVAL